MFRTCKNLDSGFWILEAFEIRLIHWTNFNGKVPLIAVKNKNIHDDLIREKLY